jgi:hypothetical protein
VTIGTEVVAVLMIPERRTITLEVTPASEVPSITETSALVSASVSVETIPSAVVVAVATASSGTGSPATSCWRSSGRLADVVCGFEPLQYIHRFDEIVIVRVKTVGEHSPHVVTWHCVDEDIFPFLFF